MLNSLLQNPFVLALAIIAALLLLLIPIALRLAGLSGQQIIDVLTLTLSFVKALVEDMRSNNKTLE